MQSGVLLAEVAEALRTTNARVSLYENGRSLGNLDRIQDLHLITVRQALCPKAIAAVKASATGGIEASNSSVAEEEGAPTAQVMAPAAGTLLQSHHGYSSAEKKTIAASLHMVSNSTLAADSDIMEGEDTNRGTLTQVEPATATEVMPRAADVLPQPAGCPQPLPSVLGLSEAPLCRTSREPYLQC